eukprot:TRINITY_DN11052_c0_g1_i1.p1 TRINITY_DN11052_c0_g1~~TRINITY_DN11052_c0_g1_i1.p1  ORF type:complete len:326 (-),score=75.60 TRINITY_DN11052_c0_g1_i1:42-1019(-)
MEYQQSSFQITSIDAPFSKPVSKSGMYTTEYWVVKKKVFDIQITSQFPLMHQCHLALSLLYDKMPMAEISLTSASNTPISYSEEIIDDYNSVLHCSIDVLTSQMENYNFVIRFLWLRRDDGSFAGELYLGTFHSVSKTDVIKRKNPEHFATDFESKAVSGKKRKHSSRSDGPDVLQELNELKKMNQNMMVLLEKISKGGSCTDTVSSSPSEGVVLEPVEPSPEEKIKKALELLSSAYNDLGVERNSKFKKIISVPNVNTNYLLEMGTSLCETGSSFLYGECGNPCCPYREQMGDWALNTITNGDFAVGTEELHFNLGDLGTISDF